MSLKNGLTTSEDSEIGSVYLAGKCFEMREIGYAFLNGMVDRISGFPNSIVKEIRIPDRFPTKSLSDLLQFMDDEFLLEGVKNPRKIELWNPIVKRRKRKPWEEEQESDKDNSRIISTDSLHYSLGTEEIILPPARRR